MTPASPPWVVKVGKGPAEKTAVRAIKALAEGAASPEQQRIALNYIQFRLAAAGEQTWVPDALGGERASSFMAGRREVGLALEKIVALPMEVMFGPEDDEHG